MRNFDAEMAGMQVRWRATNVETSEDGWQNGVSRRWILPAAQWEQGLWPGLRSGQDCSIQAYLDEHQVSRHTGSHNLKSSWISGVNMYYPFGRSSEGRALIASFLAAHVDGRITSVESIELEYAEEGPLSPSELLGEAGGSRGSGQTSPDIAYRVNGGGGLLLVENKLTEHSFYRCSARTTAGSDLRPANPDVGRCDRVADLADGAEALCHQQAWGRKYWQRLQAAVNRDAIAGLRCCPAAKAGYQLFRQQALAEGLAESGKYDFVVSCVALDARNSVLSSSLQTTGLDDVRNWGDLFAGRARFAVFTHQEWVTWVCANDSTRAWSDWSAWVNERYAV